MYFSHHFEYKQWKNISELSNDIIQFFCYLNDNKSINLVLIQHNNAKGCDILKKNYVKYVIWKDVSILLRKSLRKCYPCIKLFVSIII